MRIKSKTREFIYLDNKDKCLKENMSDYNYNFEEFKGFFDYVEFKPYKYNFHLWYLHHQYFQISQ